MRNRIAIILTGNEGYGVKRVWSNVINGLIQKGFYIDAFVIDNNQFDKGVFGDCKERFRVQVYKNEMSRSKVATNRLENLKNSLIRITTMKRIVRDVINEVYASGGNKVLYQSPLLNFALPAEFIGEISYYWMMPNVISYNYLFSLNKKLYRWFLKRNKVTVFPNSIYTGRSLGLRGITSEVIYPGPLIIDTKGSKKDLSMELNDKITLCIAASLSPIKGHENLIRAIKRLNEKGRNLELLICGGSTDSKYGTYLINICSKLDVLDKVKFLGDVENVSDIFSTSDVVISSTIIAEGFGLSIVEAMMSGKPVLANRLGGPSETILDGETGWLIDSASEFDLVSGIERCILDRPNWKTMGLKGKLRASKHFSNYTMIEQLEKWLR